MSSFCVFRVKWIYPLLWDHRDLNSLAAPICVIQSCKLLLYCLLFSIHNHLNIIVTEIVEKIHEM